MLSRRQCVGRAVGCSRFKSTNAAGRDYKAAVAALNGLQSNHSVVEAFLKYGRGQNKYAIPEMINWVRRIGYEAKDFDCLNPIHIAGTKGKGSTSSFISSILGQYLPSKHSIQAERIPSAVGLYTSPHMRFVRERIQLNSKPIPEETFARVFWEIWDRLETSHLRVEQTDPRSIGNKPVYFHFLTLMALHLFMEENVGTAVIECGIGGEYDTTNILVKPSVTGVTSLGIDHEALLGDTIDAIAWHKAGIFKEGVPAFSVQQPDKAMAILQARAQERGTKVHIVSSHTSLATIKLGLNGDFQKSNASLAIAICAQQLRRLGFSQVPDPLDPNSTLPLEFVRGLESTRLGGRCDLRFDSKLDNLTWLIDGGHTLESIELAGRWFASQTAKSKAEGSSRVLIFNQQKRDAASLARHLHQTLASALDDAAPFEHVIFCPNITYKDAGYKADLVSINTSNEEVTSLRVQRELAKAWDTIDPVATVHVVSSIEEAIAKARIVAEGKKTDAMVTGSLHLVGGVIDVLESEVE